MAVVVTLFGGSRTNVDTYDNGANWGIGTDGTLHITKIDGEEIAVYGKDNWLSARINDVGDVSQQLTVALALLREVDDGSFGHQSANWQRRATALLT